MTKSLILFLLLFCGNIYSQELIPNGSFEYNIRCPKSEDDLDACIGWTRSSAERSSDYFCACAIYNEAKDVNVPLNIFGNQYANFGNCYVGIVLIYPKGNYREYIQTKLLNKVIVGEKYKLSFYVSIADSSRNYCPVINACFSKDDKLSVIRVRKKSDHLSCGAKNCFLSFSLPNDTSIINKWIKVEQEFIATGKEVYLTIGLFEEGLTAKKSEKVLKAYPTNKSSRIPGTYVYIDDVSLIEM